MSRNVFGTMTERDRIAEDEIVFRTRLDCINMAIRSNSQERSLDEIMQSVERYAAFVFQTGVYGEQALQDPVAE